MCEPTLIATGASLVIGAASQSAAARAQNTAQRRAVGASYGQMETRQRQIGKQAAAQQSDLARQALKELSSLDTSLAEAGFDGATADRLRYESTWRAAEANTRLDQNREAGLLQSHYDNLGTRARAVSQMKPEDMNWGGIGLQLMGTALNSWAKNAGETKQPWNNPVRSSFEGVDYQAMRDR